MDSIFYILDYGKIEIRLREVLEEKNISRYRLATSINSRFEVINKWYDGKIDRIDVDILARICHVLDCDPSDIIIYKPTKKKSDL